MLLTHVIAMDAEVVVADSVVAMVVSMIGVVAAAVETVVEGVDETQDVAETQFVSMASMSPTPIVVSHHKNGNASVLLALLLSTNAIMLMVDRLAVTVDAVVAIMVNEMLTIGTRVQRNRLPVQQTTMLHRYPSLQNAVLRTEEVLAVAPTVTTTMPDTRNRLIDT